MQGRSKEMISTTPKEYQYLDSRKFKEKYFKLLNKITNILNNYSINRIQLKLLLQKEKEELEELRKIPLKQERLLK